MLFRLGYHTVCIYQLIRQDRLSAQVCSQKTLHIEREEEGFVPAGPSSNKRLGLKRNFMVALKQFHKLHFICHAGTLCSTHASLTAVVFSSHTSYFSSLSTARKSACTHKPDVDSIKQISISTLTICQSCSDRLSL